MDNPAASEGLAPERLELAMGELKPAYSDSQAITEANRCLFCYDAPCIKVCPTSIDIPGFIRKISTGNVQGAAKTILEANILGHSCARVCPVEVLCVGDCVYNLEHKPPIEIGRLQRYATDRSIAQGLKHFEVGQPTGIKVALIGAGPASLACAHELRLLGHEAVIFEGRDVPGGLNTTGVAPYKMFADIAMEEVEFILSFGVELRCGVLVGRDVTLEALEEEFDAIFLGVGLGADGWPGVAGEDLDGVWGAVDLIEHIKLDPDFDLGSVNEAVVIGGGNTAVDIARELGKLGIANVKMVYRRDEAAMGGYDHEYDYAKREGIAGVWWRQPVAFEGDGGKVTGVRVGRTQVVNGRVKVLDEEEVITADLVALAVGQGKQVEFLRSIAGLDLDRADRVQINVETGQTTNPAYFSGGDCVNGGKEVVNAAHDGKVAAHGIDGWLRSTGRLKGDD